MKIWTSLLLLLLFALNGQAQAGYDITVDIKNYDYDSLYIGYKFSNRQYIKDTLVATKPGHFEFKGTDTLKNGMYLVVLQPKNDFIEFLVDKDDHHFSIGADFQDLANTITFKGTPSNKAFAEYSAFLKSLRPKAEKLQKEIHVQDSLKNTKRKDELIAKFKKIDEEVVSYQESYIKKYAGMLPAVIIKSLEEIHVPEYKGDEKTVQEKKYYYYRKHFFDNIDFTDERLLYTNLLAKKVNYYIDKLIPQHPDTISMELDYLLKKMEPNEEMYKFYLVDFLNKFAASNIVGFDAIYVHLVKEYYAKKKAPWVKKEQLSKILRDAYLLDPVLIGKTAPNMTLFQEDGTPKSIYDVDKDYTLLYFWGPDCGHCKKSAPYLVDFYKKFKDRVSVVTICNELGGNDKLKKCWDGVKLHEFNDMINLADPQYKSHFKTVYNVKSTPTVYILNKDKKIIMKRIPVKELPKVMQQLIDIDKKKATEKTKG